MRNVPGSIVNLTVHGIGEVGRDLAVNENRTWVTVEQFEQTLDAVVGRDDVRLTFDDGNASDVEIALPRLLERGLRGEFYVLAGLIGDEDRVDEAGVRELVSAGMSVGSHGWAHRDWRRIDDNQAEEEIVAAHERLSRLTGQPVTQVAIPFGSYDARVLRRLRQARISRVYTSDGGRAHPTSWLQPRNSLRHDLSADWITEVLDDRPGLKQRLRRRAGRVYKRFRR